MNLLISAGRFVTAIAALLVILALTAIGASLGVTRVGLGMPIGAGLGALAGLLVAGSVFGALAALFQIVRLMERADQRAVAYISVQVETLGLIAETSARTAAAAEQTQRLLGR